MNFLKKFKFFTFLRFTISGNKFRPPNFPQEPTSRPTSALRPVKKFFVPSPRQTPFHPNHFSCSLLFSLTLFPLTRNHSSRGCPPFTSINFDQLLFFQSLTPFSTVTYGPDTKKGIGQVSYFTFRKCSIVLLYSSLINYYL